jgi:hypothetical protein
MKARKKVVPLNVRVDMNRRCVLRQSLALALTTAAGCGWGAHSWAMIGVARTVPPTPASPPAPAPTPSDAWIPAVPTLIVGSAATFDLSTTLPSGVNRGGKFGIDTSGASLPTGMTLNPNGTLAVGTAAVGIVSGVLFTYEEP